MSKPKLSTKTPDATETNALIDLHASIIAMPRERRYAIVELAVKDVRTDIATGDEQATLTAVHIEVPQGKAAKDLEALLDAEFQRRTNLKARPNPNDDGNPPPLDGVGDASVGV